MMNYSTVVAQLLERLPEFAKYDPAPDADLPHDVFGSFALFLCEEIRKSDPHSQDDTLKRAFEFINEMAMARDIEVVNLLVVSVLEQIGDDEHCRAAAINHLSTETRMLLQRTLDGWLEDH